MKSIFLSTFIHLIILSSVTFSFPPKSLSTKPVLTFLGSILQGDDFNVQRFTEAPITFSKSTVSLPLLEKTKSNVMDQTSLIKPPVVLNKQNKGPEKTIFEDYIKPPKREEEAQILGIEVKPPERRPLKLE
ncbi:MAG: hypothetical protein A2Z88_08645 [Omnitrophica WOR_2 bacterium GWA2_47_8]|nr:MAG: hypothetical protein A2Z88_08645 [Omnitrophica WOR_2 bacterium GWA2_47_8]